MRSPGFHVDGHPNLVRGLRCELMELQCGQQAYDAVGNLVSRFDERQVLGDAGRGRSVKPASQLPEDAFSESSGQVVPGDAQVEDVLERRICRFAASASSRFDLDSMACLGSVYQILGRCQ